MLFKKATDDLDVGIYLGVTDYGDKISFEVCHTSDGRKIVFVGSEDFEKVTSVATHYAPFPEIEYE